MRIISHYMSKEFLKMTSLCLGIFVFIYLLVDVMEKLDDFNAAGVAPDLIIRFFIFTIPNIIKQMIPVAILMGTQLTFGFLSKNNQIIAFKSSGINMIRLSFPIILLSFTATVLILILGEILVPFTNARASEIWNYRVKKMEPRAVLLQEKIWYKGDQAIYTFNKFNFKDQTAEGAILYFFDPKFKLQFRLDAEKVSWKNGTWIFMNGLSQSFQPGGSYSSQPFTEKTVVLPETPEDFRYQEKHSEEMTYPELKAYIQKVQKEGYEATRYIVEKHIRLAFPVVCIVMALFGISLALRKEKGIGISQGIVGSLLVAFVYWIFFGLSRSLGISGIFPPLWAAWSANILFLFIGSYLLLNIRQ
ncbi:MAG: LPS export ABC transporter permease LptG [Deltaproteobacteria bacterium]|nr:LPS export ABC transporter permease LptG [Deltaproteobacteria bacterium]